MVIAEMDGATCEVCRMIHGKEFAVEDARQKLLVMASRNNVPDIVKSMPFPRHGDLDNKSPNEWKRMALTPPFHSRCRCQVVMTGAVEAASPVPPPRAEIAWQESKNIAQAAHQLRQNYRLSPIGRDFYKSSPADFMQAMDVIGKEMRFLGAMPNVEKWIAKQNTIDLALRPTEFVTYPGATAHGIMGFYKPPVDKLPSRITLATKRSKKTQLNFATKTRYNVGTDVGSVARHEFAHRYYYEGGVRWEWENYYNSKGSSYFRKNVSTYGATAPEEAFAEAVAAYTSPLYKKGMMPAEIEEVLERILGA